MAIKVNARKNSWWWKWFHPCEFEFVEDIHFWIRQLHLHRKDSHTNWYEYSHRVMKCKHCGKVKNITYTNATLPIGGRNVFIGTIH